MHLCETSQLKNRPGEWVEIQNPIRCWLTRKLSKTKFHQMIKSKMKVKDTSENANRKKAGARFYYRIKKKIEFKA